MSRKSVLSVLHSSKLQLEEFVITSEFTQPDKIDLWYVLHFDAGFHCFNCRSGNQFGKLANCGLYSWNDVHHLLKSCKDGNGKRGEVMSLVDAIEFERNRLEELVQLASPTIHETTITAIECTGGSNYVGVTLRGVDANSVKPGDVLVKK